MSDAKCHIICVCVYTYTQSFSPHSNVEKDKKLRSPRSEHSDAEVGSLALFLTTVAYNELKMTSIFISTTDYPTGNFLVERI